MSKKLLLICRRQQLKICKTKLVKTIIQNRLNPSYNICKNIKIYGSPPASVSTHFTLMELQIFMHTLPLHLGPKQISIYSLNLVKMSMIQFHLVIDSISQALIFLGFWGTLCNGITVFYQNVIWSYSRMWFWCENNLQIVHEKKQSGNSVTFGSVMFLPWLVPSLSARGQNLAGSFNNISLNIKF